MITGFINGVRHGWPEFVKGFKRGWHKSWGDDDGFAQGGMIHGEVLRVKDSVPIILSPARYSLDHGKTWLSSEELMLRIKARVSTRRSRSSLGSTNGE